MSEAPKPGMRAIVRGRGREVVPGSGDSGYRDGEEVEATLVRQIGNASSDRWFVYIDGDIDSFDNKIKRSRQIIRLIE